MFQEQNMISYGTLSTTGVVELLFPSLSFQAGSVIHFTILKLYPNAVCTLTQDHPSEKGLIIKFVKPNNIDRVKEMLITAS
jgi:hypothetical protein